MPPEICPACGAMVPADARACPECGADEETGWSEEARRSNELDLGLPDEDFDYEKVVEREFGQGKPEVRKFPWFWWLIALLLLAALLSLWFF